MVGELSPDRVDALVWALTELFPTITKKVVEKKPLTRTVVEAFPDRSGNGWMTG
jgi:phage terminase large subunit-like protein